MPTAGISCGMEKEEGAPRGANDLAGEQFTIDGAKIGFGEFLKQSHTLSFIAMKRGQVVADWAANDASLKNQHLLFSVTKSMTGMLAGILADKGLLDPEATVCAYMPEAKGSAYETATVRDLLDMRTSLDFDESYLNRDGDYARYRRATGWNPDEPGSSETMSRLLMSIPLGVEPHGGPFFYASPNTDVLGLVIERAGGCDYATLMSELVWKPLGAQRHAYITLDRAGAPRGAGGMCATPNDLARVGEMIRTGGTSKDGQRVVSSAWIEDMLYAGDHEAWATGNFADFFPDGRYRNCWYLTGYPEGAYCGIGIHGQWIYIDPKAQAVLVKFSAQPDPLDEPQDRRCLQFFRGVCAVLGG